MTTSEPGGSGRTDPAMPANGPAGEASGGASPPAPAPEGRPVIVRDSRPWLTVGLVLLAIFLAILVYAVVLPALQ